MDTSNRRAIRFEQFERPKRRWGKVMVYSAVSVVIIGALAGAYLHFGNGVEIDNSPPTALSQAGKPTANESYQWSPVAIGGGGFISGLAMDPNGKTFLARADVYGAYIWDEEANRWQQLVKSEAFPEADRVQDGLAEGAFEIAIAPSQPDRLYMAIRGKVYRSDDRGKNWRLASAASPFPLRWDANSEWRLYGSMMVVDPQNADLLVLGTPDNGLWRSADGGGTWAHVSSVPATVDRGPEDGVQGPGTLVWFEQPAGGKSTGRIFAFASGSGMYVSADKGHTFAPLQAVGDRPRTMRRGAFTRKGSFIGVDDESKAIWKYKDGRWQNVTLANGLRATDYAAVAVDPRSDRVVVLDQSGKGYVSSDDGDRWSTISYSAKVGEGDPPWLKVANNSYFSTGDLHFDPVKKDRLWIAHGTGVFYADLAAGQTHLSWVSQSRGIEELVANDVVQTTGHAPIFAAWDFGMHIKSDLNRYSDVFVPDRSFIAVQQVEWTPADPSFLVTNASDTRQGCCWEDGKAVMAGYSQDGGKSWTRFATLPTPPGTKSDDPWRMAFGTIAVSAGDTKNIIWAPAKNRTPFYTKDRGRSWYPVRLEGATGDNPGSFLSTWYQRKTLVADRVKSGTFYLVHSGEAPNQGLMGVWRTENGGEAWEQVYRGEIAPDNIWAAKIRAVPDNAGHLFFTSAVSSGADLGLRRSIDGGESWQKVTDVSRVDDIAFGKAASGRQYPTIFISGRVKDTYGIWRSIDNAKTWVRLTEFPMSTLDQVTVVAADPDVFGRVYIGYKGSGWIWGEPAPCKAAPYRMFDKTQCSGVGQ